MENKYGFIRDGKVFAVAFASFPEREIGEVKGTDEEALDYFANRFVQLEEKVNDVIEKVETSNNKGSFLMKLKHLQDTLADQKAIGDFECLLSKVKEAERHILEEIEQNRKRNLEIKKVLLAELEALVRASHIQKIDELKAIQQRWIKVGKAVEEQEEDLQEKYNQLTDHFFEHRKELQEAKYELYKEREAQYRAIIKKAQSLSAKLGDTKDDLDALHHEWKALEKVPQKLTEELWGEFQEATSQFYKGQRKVTQQQGQNAKELKSSLLNDFKTALENAKGDSSKLVKEYIQRWKALKARVQDLDDQFYGMVDYEFEKNFFLKIVMKKLQKAVNEEEKKAIALKTLKDLIRRDTDDLHRIEETIGKVHINASDKKNPFNSRIKLQERKLYAKKQLLQEFNANSGNFI